MKKEKNVFTVPFSKKISSELQILYFQRIWSSSVSNLFQSSLKEMIEDSLIYSSSPQPSLRQECLKIY